MEVFCRLRSVWIGRSVLIHPPVKIPPHFTDVQRTAPNSMNKLLCLGVGILSLGWTSFCWRVLPCLKRTEVLSLLIILHLLCIFPFVFGSFRLSFCVLLDSVNTLLGYPGSQSFAAMLLHNLNPLKSKLIFWHSCEICSYTTEVLAGLP